VVVDSFSTDKTVEIAESLGCRVIKNVFQGHIEQKNIGLDQCTFDHVLSLDADEALSPELERSILQVKNNWKYDGYSMNRLSNYCGKWIHHCGWYPDTKLRLVDRTKARWGGTNPHDKLLLANNTVSGHLKGDLLHYTLGSFTEHLKQINYFTDIGARMAYEKGRRSNLLLILFSPVFKFFKDYVIKLGFLDGFYGFVISYNSAFATYLKYLKIWELGKKDK
jgi:glycosyltransferase involved in cell wall biosynthesis